MQCFRETRKAVLVGAFLMGLVLICAALLGNAVTKSTNAAEAIRQTSPME